MKEQLIEIIEEILEEEVTLTSEFNDENWDSLNIISFIAAINSSFQIVLEAEKVGKVTTVGELIQLVEKDK